MLLTKTKILLSKKLPAHDTFSLNPVISAISCASFLLFLFLFLFPAEG